MGEYGIFHLIYIYIYSDMGEYLTSDMGIYYISVIFIDILMG